MNCISLNGESADAWKRFLKLHCHCQVNLLNRKWCGLIILPSPSTDQWPASWFESNRLKRRASNPSPYTSATLSNSPLSRPIQLPSRLVHAAFFSSSPTTSHTACSIRAFWALFSFKMDPNFLLNFVSVNPFTFIRHFRVSDTVANCHEMV